MTGSEGPKIFRGTDSNSTLVVTPPSKPQRRPTIILAQYKYISLNFWSRVVPVNFSEFHYALLEVNFFVKVYREREHYCWLVDGNQILLSLYFLTKVRQMNWLIEDELQWKSISRNIFSSTTLHSVEKSSKTRSPQKIFRQITLQKFMKLDFKKWMFFDP